ncbi:leukocidin family pore-forming toxin [Faecalimicrobium sp. JNUCC 81]
MSDQIKTYTSSKVYSFSNKFKVVLDGTFIDDPKDNQLTLLLSTEGSFIPSGMVKTGDYWWGKMIWPSVYSIDADLIDRDNSRANILKCAPINTIETINVSETMGYSIGGSIDIKGSSSDGGSVEGGGGVTGNYTVSKTISYKQPDYQTILKENTLNKSFWNVSFNKDKQGYDRDSWNPVYGNQLFMRSRYSNTGLNNLTLDNDLSSLIVGGFSPKVLLAIKRPRTDFGSGNYSDVFRLTLIRTMDEYNLSWTNTEWKGVNNKNYTSETALAEFLIDWELHQIR